MKCEACRTLKHESLNSYGGCLICDYCYDKYNPKTSTVHLMSEATVRRLEEEQSKLKRRLSGIEFQLKMNKMLIETNQTKITYKIND